MVRYTGTGAVRAPSPPGGSGVVQARLALCPGGQDQRFLVRVRQRDDGRGTGLAPEAGCDGIAGELRISRVPGADRDGIRSKGGHRDAGTVGQVRCASAVAEARLDAPAHGDAAGEALNPPDQFPVRAPGKC